VITVTGSNFVDSPQLACRFGSVVVPATWLFTTQIRCISPALDFGTTELRVSNNNQDFRATINFTFDRTFSKVKVSFSDGCCR